MRWLHGLRARTRLLFHRSAEERMSEEMRFHLEMATRENLRAGMPPGEARRRALLAFGGVEGHKEELRGGRTLAWVGGLRLDLKLAVRMLRKHPGLTVIGGLGMALGVAISVGVFSMMAMFAFPTLPLEEGERIVALENFDAASHNEERPTLHDLALWREELASVRDLGGFRTVERNLVVGEGPVAPVQLAEMTASGFQLARVPPLLGRYLVAEDEQRGAAPVVVIGYDLWRERLAGDPAVVGRALQLDGRVHTVVGVMPEGFAFPLNHQLWIPLRADPLGFARGEAPEIFVFGRLAPGVELERAEAELTALGRRTAAAYPRTNAQIRPIIGPYAHPLTGMERGVSAWELAQAQLMVSLLLVVVALNVAVLVYARTATRWGEIAVRSALGASRGRIVTQLFAEALVLSLGAAALGFVFAQVAVRLLVRFTQTEGAPPPFWLDFGLRPAAVLLTIGLAVLAAVIVGVLPAIQASGSGLQRELRQLGGTTRMRLGRTWTALIVAQVAIAVAVLPAAVNQGWSALPAAATVPTYPAGEFLSARLDLDAESSAEEAAAGTREATTGFGARLTELMARLEEEPAVAGVTYQASLPGRGGLIRVEDVPAPPASPSGHVVASAGVHPGYFDLFGAALLAGRRFEPGDLRDDASAVIVNESFVRQLLGGASAVGRRIRHVGAEEADGSVASRPAHWLEIVGVVEDLQVNRLDPEQVAPGVFHAVAPGQAQGATLAVRLRGTTPDAFAPRLRELTAAVDPSLRLGMVRSLASDGLGDRFAAGGVGLVVLLVLLIVFLLSAAGIYALMSLTVTQRRREIGIRTALGGPPMQVLRGVFTRSASQIALGLAVGVVLAMVVERLTGGELMDGRGLVILPAIAGAMAVVGLLAALGPARRGLRVQPMETLRQE